MTRHLVFDPTKADAVQQLRQALLVPGEDVAIHLPWAAGRELILEGRFPLSEDEWDQLLRSLEAMRVDPRIVDPS